MKRLFGIGRIIGLHIRLITRLALTTRSWICFTRWPSSFKISLEQNVVHLEITNHS